MYEGQWMSVAAAELKIVQAPTAPLGEAVAGLISEGCAEGYDWVDGLEESWTQRPFDRTGEGLFLAWLGDRLVGFAAISEDQHLADGTTGRLRYVYVSSAARGRGVAAALIEGCLARAGDRWSAIRLHTDNPAAARLYARYGFASLGDAQPGASHVLVRG
jgi:GNAT superfamily N-acetyltransferase